MKHHQLVGVISVHICKCFHGHGTAQPCEIMWVSHLVKFPLPPPSPSFWENTTHPVTSCDNRYRTSQSKNMGLKLRFLVPAGTSDTSSNVVLVLVECIITSSNAFSPSPTYPHIVPSLHPSRHVVTSISWCSTWRPNGQLLGQADGVDASAQHDQHEQNLKHGPMGNWQTTVRSGNTSSKWS